MYVCYKNTYTHSLQAKLEYNMRVHSLQTKGRKKRERDEMRMRDRKSGKKGSSRNNRVEEKGDKDRITVSYHNIS